LLLSGCGNQVVDATSKMDGGAGASSNEASGGRAASGGASSGGSPASGGASGGVAANTGGAGTGGGTLAGSGGTAGIAGSDGNDTGGRGSGGMGTAMAGSGGAGAPPVPSADSGSDAMGSTSTCKNPVFHTSDPNGGVNDGGYYIHNNMWNTSAGLGPETLTACSYHDWYVVSNQTNSAGAVKTYPNVHKDYADVPISSFKSLTSKFAERSPHVGIYDVAYDIWTNGVATSGSTEFMIWTENYKQVPAGKNQKTVTLGGRSYAVWKTDDSHYIAFVPSAPFTSGTVDILEIFQWTISQGWLPSTSTLGQLDFGVEIVETGGGDATFYFDDFSISSS
jgi:hypothetical protein